MLDALVMAADSAEAPNPLLPAMYDIVWSAVCFAIILFVVIKFVIPKLTAILDERSEAIEGNIAKADEAQKQAEAALEEYNKQLAEARAEAAEIREKARAEGKAIVAEHTADAQAQSDRIVAAGQSKVASEYAAAHSQLQNEVGALALDLASGVVGESLTDDKRASAVIDRFLADLNAETAAK